MIDKQKYIDKMKEYRLNSKTDEEVAHCDADDLLCELLIELGYKEVVDEFNHDDFHRWYA